MREAPLGSTGDRGPAEELCAVHFCGPDFSDEPLRPTQTIMS